MATNHLEQLLAEWYEYRGYFLRRNVLVGRRARGGYAGELDIVAFHPGTRHLVHVEASLDAGSWEWREERFARKFELGREHIPALLAGFDLPDSIDQRAVLLFASTANRATLGGARLVTVAEVLAEILAALRPTSVLNSIIPEHLPNLRTLQFVAHHRHALSDVLRG